MAYFQAVSTCQLLCPWSPEKNTQQKYEWMCGSLFVGWGEAGKPFLPYWLLWPIQSRDSFQELLNVELHVLSE